MINIEVFEIDLYVKNKYSKVLKMYKINDLVRDFRVNNRF